MIEDFDGITDETRFLDDNERSSRPASPSGPLRARKETWSDLKPYVRPLLATNFISVVCGINDGSIGAIIPRLKDFYDIPSETVSFLFLFNSMGYLVSALSNGHIVQRFGQLNTLYMGGIMLCFTYTVISFGLPFPIMAGFMLIQGMGVDVRIYSPALLDAGMNVYTTTVPMATLMLNILHAMYGVGAMASPLIASLLLHMGLHWRAMYIIMALVALLNVLLTVVGFRGAKVEMVDKDGDDQQQQSEQKGVVSEALLHPMTMLCAAYILIYVGTEVVVGGWGLTFLIEGRHGSEITMANVIAGYWASLAVGRIILGYLVEKFGEKPSIHLCTFATIVAMAVLLTVENLTINVIAIISIGFFLGPMFPSTVALASKVLPRRLHPASIGFIAGTGAGGAAFFPFVTGQISGRFGILSMPIVCLIMAVVMQLLWTLVPSSSNDTIFCCKGRRNSYSVLRQESSSIAQTA
ncbi:major facilitator superfamily domain-containing protein [Dichotomocladium elegans]|nr:major facilitator superfamily domain-containing protein [Dichotomocladium elegans]